MDFPKKQGQRLIPDYLLDYTTDLQKNHPDPSASWGGGSGGSYTGGDGIDITNNVISVDNTVAKKSDIPTKTSDLTNDSGFITSSALTSYVTTTQLEDALDDYALSTDIPTEVSQLTNDAGYTTQTWVQNQGYITGITSSDVVTALGYTPGTSNFSGSYNDLTDKPTIPTNYVTTNTRQTITGTKTFTGEVNVSNVFGGSDLSVRNDITLVGFSYNSREFELPVSKPVTQGIPYTLATTDDIPTVNNPTITFTQGGVSKGTITLNQASNQTIALDAGGGGTYTLNKTTETLTFTYSDNTTGTLTVVTDVTLVQS